MNELHLFAGAGGGILGGILLGHTTVCAVEIEPYCRKVLLQRQRDGILPKFPIWDDVQTFDGRPWRGKVDIVCGGFPCQDISSAGKGAGIEGERSGMWKHMARIIGEIRPKYAFVENSPLLVGRGLAMVLGDLAKMGYDAKWCVLGAHHVGAPHKRDRIWIMAHSNSRNVECGQSERPRIFSEEAIEGANDNASGSSKRHETHVPNSNVRGCDDGRDIERQHKADNAEIWETQKDQQSRSIGKHRIGADCSDLSNAASIRQQGQGQSWFGSDPAEAREGETDRTFTKRIGHLWGIESPVGRVAHGVANRVDRLKAIGNGQVPAVAALAWNTLTSPFFRFPQK